MSQLADNPALHAYAVAAVVLSLNWLVLWNLSGVFRSRTKTTTNPEDAPMLRAELVDRDPPEVARVLRAHRNTADNTTPFLLLGLVFVLLGGAELPAQIVFGAFAAARVLYSLAYVLELQPWRSLFYAAGVLSTLALIVLVVRQLVLCQCA